jgi:hypothetical protein
MSLWAAIKKSVNSDLNVPLDTLIKSLQATANSIQTTATSILTYTSRSGVKSVQRGIASGAIYSGYTSDITISSVDPSKCSVSLYGDYIKSGTFGWQGSNTASAPFMASAPYVNSLTATKLSVCGALGGQSATFSWEIIEYY